MEDPDMSLLQAGYIAIFVFATVGCFWGAARTHVFEDSEIRRPLSVFLSLTGVWGATGVFLLIVPSLRAMTWVYMIGLVVGFGTVFAWLWFCSAYAGQTYHYDRRIQAIAAGLFGVVVAIKLTNPFHGLYFVPAMTSEPFVHFAPEVGVVYWTVTAIAYAGSAIGLYMLFELYFASRFNSLKIGLLTVIIALPVLPKLLAVGRGDSLLLLYYEPIGAAIFAIGVVSVAREGFLSVRAPGRRQLADRLADPVFIVDSEDRLVEYNESAASLFDGLSKGVGQPISEAAPAVADAETGETIELTHDNQKRYYLVGRSVITLGTIPVGRSVVLSDVTKLENQRRHLEQQTTHLENLTEAMAHELRNPLTIVRGNLELLREELSSELPADPPTKAPLAADENELDGNWDGDGETAAKSAGGTAPIGPTAERISSAKAALSAIERIEDVVDDLISIMEYGTPISEMEPYPIRSIVADAEASFEGEIEWHGNSDRQIVADRGRCVELFRHLLRLHEERNASIVSIELLADGFAVESDGDPFVTADHDQLFQYGTETGENTRIILANAWTLSNLHGWSIEADPDAEGPRIVVSDVIYASDDSDENDEDSR